MDANKIVQFHNCRILRNHRLIWDDLWVRNGIIQNPRLLFFEEKKGSDIKIDCKGKILSPGFIDLQINGGFEIDFSSNVENVEFGVQKVAKGLLQYGVTSFCPTIVTSPSHIYKAILAKIQPKKGSKNGAAILGVHLEGPFICHEKKGAHPEKFIRKLTGCDSVLEVYGDLTNVKIVTLAPELDNACEVIKMLSEKGIIVSLGHSVSNLEQAENAVNSGAKLITHLFNAMLPFHHRDPGIVGLLTSKKIDKQIYYGMISDGIHTNPAALRIAHRANPKGMILVTDAISAMGLEPGTYQLGQQHVTIDEKRAFVANTKTLAGSIATLPHCIRHFKKATLSSIEEALEAATLHPAECLGMENTIGTLNYGAQADFVLLTDDLQVYSTYIAGQLVYSNSQVKI
nr:N-acetylglucosamine-6-phosphate deacetylase-like [Ciona intestinalis]|eukprot:XP_002130591.1 N-acetylglucosamine-6-phosphate deacetylase-like [Ciona intestinalis]